jgi:PAS domain S-box-containing protein
MTFYTWLHFVSFLIYVILASYVLGRNIKAFINIITALLLLCFALWSFGNFMMFNEFSTLESSEIMLKIAAPGWIFFSSIYMLFIFELTGNKKVLNNRFVLSILILIPSVFLILALNKKMILCCDKTFFGYTGIWEKNIWVRLYYIYYISFFITGTILLIKYIFKEKSRNKKNSSLILLITMVFCFISGTISSVILKETKNYIPVEANNFLLIFAGGILYSMLKYEFLTVSTKNIFEKIIETMNDGIILIDANHNILEINETAKNIFKNSLIKYELREVFIDITRAEKVENKEISININKENKILLLSVFPIIISNEEMGYLIIFKDITDLKIAQIELEQTVKKLTEVNQELKRFADIAAHVLKEPVRTISTYVEYFTGKYTNKIDDDSEQCIKFIKENALKLNNLINGLYEYARSVSNLNFKLVDFKKIVYDVVALLDAKIKEKNAIIKIASDLPKLNADEVQIMRVFQNIIDNSIKFCDEQPEIEIKVNKTNGYYEFAILNNTDEIKEEDREKIFKIFHKMHNKGNNGLGIGLFLCKKIIEEHNGRIWVDKRKDGKKGNAFYFILPERNNT